jgi:hypothetical protein
MMVDTSALAVSPVGYFLQEGSGGSFGGWCSGDCTANEARNEWGDGGGLRDAGSG